MPQIDQQQARAHSNRAIGRVEAGEFVAAEKELQKIVLECLPALDSDYQRVLKMRANGLKYGDIALRMGVSENTVATWVSRGIRTLAQCVRKRTQPRGKLKRTADGR